MKLSSFTRYQNFAGILRKSPNFGQITFQRQNLGTRCQNLEMFAKAKIFKIPLGICWEHKKYPCIPYKLPQLPFEYGWSKSRKCTEKPAIPTQCNANYRIFSSIRQPKIDGATKASIF